MFSIYRYWGTPIPLWMSEDGLETVCIGSIAELEELSGVKAERNGEKDLHRETIDKITIPSKRPGEFSLFLKSFNLSQGQFKCSM